MGWAIWAEGVRGVANEGESRRGVIVIIVIARLHGSRFLVCLDGTDDDDDDDDDDNNDDDARRRHTRAAPAQSVGPECADDDCYAEQFQHRVVALALYEACHDVEAHIDVTCRALGEVGCPDDDE